MDKVPGQVLPEEPHIRPIPGTFLKLS